MQTGRFICDKCERELPDEQLRSAGNYGWGVVSLCCDCEPNKSPEEIVEELALFMHPPRELPE